MPYPVPIPGSAPARLIESAITHFQNHGFADAGVVDIATDAGVTTGSLYHHFGSKQGLYSVIREEMERRMTERLEGAAAASSGRSGLLAAFRVTLEAAQRFTATRILSEPPVGDDPVAAAFSTFVTGSDLAGALVAAMWREALRSMAAGTGVDEAVTSVAAILGVDAGSEPD